MWGLVVGVEVGRGGLGLVCRRTGVNLPAHPLGKALFLEGLSPRCPASQLHAPTRDGKQGGSFVFMCVGGVLMPRARLQVCMSMVSRLARWTVGQNVVCQSPFRVSKRAGLYPELKIVKQVHRWVDRQRLWDTNTGSVPCHSPPFGLRKYITSSQ